MLSGNAKFARRIMKGSVIFMLIKTIKANKHKLKMIKLSKRMDQIIDTARKDPDCTLENKEVFDSYLQSLLSVNSELLAESRKYY